MRTIAILIFLFITFFSKGQEVSVYKESRELCSTTLYLKEDSTFIIEGGCEGSSQTSYGIWFFHEDTVILNAKKPKQFKIVEVLSKDSTKHTAFRIYDVLMRPIRNLQVVFYGENDNYNISETNDNGYAISYQKNIQYAYFPQLSLWLNKREELILNGVTGLYQIQINIDPSILHYPEPKILNDMPDLRFLKKEKQLVRISKEGTLGSSLILLKE